MRMMLGGRPAAACAACEAAPVTKVNTTAQASAAQRVSTANDERDSIKRASRARGVERANDTRARDQLKRARRRRSMPADERALGGLLAFEQLPHAAAARHALADAGAVRVG